MVGSPPPLTGKTLHRSDFYSYSNQEALSIITDNHLVFHDETCQSNRHTRTQEHSRRIFRITMTRSCAAAEKPHGPLHNLVIDRCTD